MGRWHGRTCWCWLGSRKRCVFVLVWGLGVRLGVGHGLGSGKDVEEVRTGVLGWEVVLVLAWE
jgi:hypothetical protein